MLIVEEFKVGTPVIEKAIQYGEVGTVVGFYREWHESFEYIELSIVVEYVLLHDGVVISEKRIMRPEHIKVFEE